MCFCAHRAVMLPWKRHGSVLCTRENKFSFRTPCVSAGYYAIILTQKSPVLGRRRFGSHPMPSLSKTGFPPHTQEEKYGTAVIYFHESKQWNWALRNHWSGMQRTDRKSTFAWTHFLYIRWIKPSIFQRNKYICIICVNDNFRDTAEAIVRSVCDEKGCHVRFIMKKFQNQYL